MSSDLTVNINAVDNTSATMKKVGSSTKELIVGFSGLATSAFSLYNAYDRINTASLSLEHANLKVKSTANGLEDAQRRQKQAADNLEQAERDLAKAIDTTGEDSEATAKAQAKLQKATEDYNAIVKDVEIAQERNNVAIDTAKRAQDDFTKSIVATGLQIVPTTITMVDSFAKIQVAAATAAGAQGVGGLTKALTTLNSIGAIVIPVTVVIGIVYAIQQAIDYIKEKFLFPEMQKQAAGQGPTPKSWEEMQKGLGLSGVPVPHGAAGGLITKPTLMVAGEKGPEALVPLEQGIGGVTINQYFTVDSWTDLSKVREAAAEGASQGISESLRRRGR